MRQTKQIYKIQPLQIDTVELLPNSAIPGSIGTVKNTVGSSMAARVTIERNALPLADGNYKIVVVTAAGTYKIVNEDTGFESAVLTSSDTFVENVVSGLKIKVAAFTGETIGNSASFSVVGDQTYIIPGTVIGRIASGNTKGKWRPVMSTDVLTTFDQFRICTGFQETDKNKTVLTAGYENNISNVFIIDVCVYGQLIENVCNEINLKAVSGLKEKMPFYAWI